MGTLEISKVQNQELQKETYREYCYSTILTALLVSVYYHRSKKFLNQILYLSYRYVFGWIEFISNNHFKIEYYLSVQIWTLKIVFLREI